MNWTQSLARRGVSMQSQYLVALGLGIIAGVIVDPMAVPFTSLMVPLLLGSILLGPKRLPFFVLFVTILQGLQIDTDHWRHMYLLFGLVWGLGVLSPGPAARSEGDAAQRSLRTTT